MGNQAPKRILEIKGECTICAENPVKLVLLSSRCNHSPSVCEGCHKNSISNDIQTKGTHHFHCPVSNCSIQYEPDEYYHLLSGRDRDLVDKLLLNRTLEQMEEFRWCKSEKGCGAGQLVSNHAELLGYYTCHMCHTQLCFRHSIRWHVGFSCNEFDSELAKKPDLASNTAVLACSKPCPNERCKTPIMKGEGCDVIKCCRYGTHDCDEAGDKCDHGGKNYCGQKFCWKCLGKMEFNKKLNRWIRNCNANCEYASLNG